MDCEEEEMQSPTRLFILLLVQHRIEIAHGLHSRFLLADENVCALCVSPGFMFLVCGSGVLCARRALQQFETYHDGEVLKLHQFEVMQLANLMQADSEVEEVRCS